MTSRTRSLLLLLSTGFIAPLAAAAPPGGAIEPAAVYFRAPDRSFCLADGVRLRTHSLADDALVRITTSMPIDGQPALALLAEHLRLRAYTIPPEPEPEPVEDGWRWRRRRADLLFFCFLDDRFAVF
ncbi:MAG: hypothetical protein AAFV53_25710, partial [Myxococcota bacterium]